MPRSYSAHPSGPANCEYPLVTDPKGQSFGLMTARSFLVRRRTISPS